MRTTTARPSSPGQTPRGHAHPPDTPQKSRPDPSPRPHPAHTTPNRPERANHASSAASTTPDHDHTAESSEPSQNPLKPTGQNPPLRDSLSGAKSVRSDSLRFAQIGTKLVRTWRPIVDGGVAISL